MIRMCSAARAMLLLRSAGFLQVLTRIGVHVGVLADVRLLLQVP